MSLFEMIKLALQLVAALAPVISKVGKDGAEEVDVTRLPAEAKVILDALATKAPSTQA